MKRRISKTVSENLSRPNAYIITGPTSGIGRAAALELAKHGTVSGRTISGIMVAIRRRDHKDSLGQLRLALA